MPRDIAMVVTDTMCPGSRQQTIRDAGAVIDPRRANSMLLPLYQFNPLAARDTRGAQQGKVTMPEKSMPLRFGLLFAVVLCCTMLTLLPSTAAGAVIDDVAAVQALMAQQAQPAGMTGAQHAPQPGAMQVPSTITGVSTAPSSKQIALAETLLFQTNHLRNVTPASVLMYAFRKAGSLEPGFDDQVKLVVNAGRGAGHAATMLFLSGPRQHQSPEVEDPEGNPVLLGFLERDIAEMHRLTGGSTNYFRKRIRLALADAAQVRLHRFTYGGAPAEGREVVIEPYRNDPMHERFEAYTRKRYVFIVSEQVPGGIYQVRATLPATAGSAAPQAKPGTPLATDRAPAPAARDTAGATTASKPASASTPPLVDETMTLVSVEHGKR